MKEIGLGKEESVKEFNEMQLEMQFNLRADMGPSTTREEQRHSEVMLAVSSMSSRIGKIEQMLAQHLVAGACDNAP
jgi:hypothetical protein